MSVIAYDGKMIAADRQMTTNDLRASCTKLFRNRDTIVACIGNFVHGKALIRWALDGEDREDWPELDEDDEDWARIIVWNKNGIYTYDQLPEPIMVEDKFMAWGAGRDFAISAMAMGASAKEAVDLACRYNIYCGMGIDVMTLKGKK